MNGRQKPRAGRLAREPWEEIKRVRTRPARLRLIARKLFGTLRTEVTLSLRSRLARNRLRVQRAG